MDLILRNARVVGNESVTTDIGIDKGRIAVIQPKLTAEGETLDLGGRLVTPGFIETHIHLDKSRILGRCKAERGDLEEAIGEVARQKKLFTAEDVYTSPRSRWSAQSSTARRTCARSWRSIPASACADSKACGR